MSNNDNNILLARQGNCSLSLITEGGGDFPVGSKVLHYKDKNGNDQSVDLTNLEDGSNLFDRNANLNVDWGVSLPNLSGGFSMFSGSGLTSFNADLPNLSNGQYMFFGSGLTSWTTALPNLSNGSEMFQECSGLTSFNADLPNLSNGSYMFYWCSGLTSFNADLPNLTDGTAMFFMCKLDKASVHHIAGSIPTKPDGATLGYKLTLGINASLQNDADVAADLETIRTTKKWALTTQWN